MKRCKRSIMSRRHSLQHIEGFCPTTLPDHNSIWTHSQGICEIAGFSWSEEKLRCLVDQYYVRDFVTGECEWRSYPAWLDDLPYLGIATGEEVEQWKRK